MKDIKLNSLYTQGQRYAASALLTLWILASGSPEGAFATPGPKATLEKRKASFSASASLPSYSPPRGPQKTEDETVGDPSLQGPSPIIPQRLWAVPEANEVLSEPLDKSDADSAIYDSGPSIQELLKAAQEERARESGNSDLLGKMSQMVPASTFEMDRLQQLTKAAKDPNAVVRQNALAVMAQMAIADPLKASDIIKILEAASKDEDETVQNIVYNALRNIYAYRQIYSHSGQRGQAISKAPRREVCVSQREREYYNSKLRAQQARHEQELAKLEATYKSEQQAQERNVHLEQKVGKLQRAIAKLLDKMQKQQACHAAEQQAQERINVHLEQKVGELKKYIAKLLGTLKEQQARHEQERAELEAFYESELQAYEQKLAKLKRKLTKHDVRFQ